MAAATTRITLGTADEVVLVPISAAEPGPARDLVDAAIAAF